VITSMMQKIQTAKAIRANPPLNSSMPTRVGHEVGSQRRASIAASCGGNGARSREVQGRIDERSREEQGGSESARAKSKGAAMSARAKSEEAAMSARAKSKEARCRALVN
jgi:hypothetical protein